MHGTARLAQWIPGKSGAITASDASDNRAGIILTHRRLGKPNLRPGLCRIFMDYAGGAAHDAIKKNRGAHPFLCGKKMQEFFSGKNLNHTFLLPDKHPEPPITFLWATLDSIPAILVFS